MWALLHHPAKLEVIAPPSTILNGKQGKNNENIRFSPKSSLYHKKGTGGITQLCVIRSSRTAKVLKILFCKQIS
jgi:hypothetical protein